MDDTTTNNSTGHEVGVKRKSENKTETTDKKSKSFGHAKLSSEEKNNVSVMFSLPMEPCGQLADALKFFKKRDIHLYHIESRPSKLNKDDYDFFVDVDPESYNPENVKLVMEDLKTKTKSVALLTENEVPWFPRKIAELDKFADRVLTYGAELDADHPGFKDPVYRARRKYFADIAYNFKHGQPIPRIEYTEDEIKVWNVVYTNLTKLHKELACREVNYMFPLLVENCNYRLGAIPQLEDVSNFLKDCTGFTIRPVAGMLSSRDFLAGLAFRVFHATQYIRHSKDPMYTPEPDCVHELMGHVALFADPNFAQFSQEIGLASLGAPDDWIDKLASLYLFSVEFGICRQNGKLKAFGAGLLSSGAELQHALSDKSVKYEFDPEKLAATKYVITEYQKQYFIADSFEDAKEKVRQWSKTIPRQFTVHYNPYTQRVEVLDNQNKIVNMVNEVKSTLDVLVSAIRKID